MIVAFVDDLMDRSRISAAFDGVKFQRAIARDEPPKRDVDVVVIDLAKHAAIVSVIRAGYPTALLIGFAPHVDEASVNAAQVGVDRALPRSRFFRDVAAALATP